MPRSNRQMIKNLQAAINQKFNQELLIDKVQWYSKEGNRPITLYKIKKPAENPELLKSKYIELFSTTSQIQIVLFLRDYWYKLNNWQIPKDNEVWEKAKDSYYNRHKDRLIDSIYTE